MKKYLMLLFAVLLLPSTASAAGLGSVACIAVRDILQPYGVDVSCSYLDTGNGGNSYVVVLNNGQSLVNPMQVVGMVAAAVVGVDKEVPTRSDYLVFTNPAMKPALRWRMSDLRACAPLAEHDDAMFVSCVGSAAQSLK